MPVHKYRSVSDMPPPGRAEDPDLASRIRVLWARAFLLHPRAPHRGVRRFRTIAEANAARERDTLERMRRRPRPR
jgi:hypothetical protein